MAPAFLKTLGVLATAGLMASGCLFRAFEEQNEKDARRETAHNGTLAKAALILDAVQEWGARHGGDLPGPDQFRREVGAYVKGKSAPLATAEEVEEAFGRFVWTFPGGKPTGEPSETEVGHLSEPNGEAVGYADGSVRRWRTIRPPQ
jgi:hypothetical protein